MKNVTQMDRVRAIFGIGYTAGLMRKFYSRRFLFLDLLSGGRLSAELWRIERCLNAACLNHERVWLPDYPDLMPMLRKGKTEAEVHDALNKTLNDAKGILFQEIYQM